VQHQAIFRDSQGRVRTEAGTTVTISDPTTGTTTILDTAAGTYRQVSAPAQPGLSTERRAPVSHQPLSSAPRTLGEATIDGIIAAGREYTVTAPATVRRPAQEYTVTVWAAPEIQLPVQTRIVQPDGTIVQRTYTDLQVGAEPAAELFEIPAGYVPADRVLGPTPAQTDCQVVPSVLFMTSIGSFLASGVVFADVLGQDCVFIADAALFELQLSGAPLTPLGLPFDDWFVFDNGAPVPVLPWTAFGIIDYAATAPNSPVVGDTSLIVLDIF